MNNKEAHKLEKQSYDSMDRVDRRDKGGEIISMVSNEKFRKNFDNINWGGK